MIRYHNNREGDIMSVNLDLAICNLKRYRRDSTTMIILSTIIYTLLLSLSLCLPTYFNALNLKMIVENGKWIHYDANIDSQKAKYLQAHNDEVALMSQLGLADYDGNNYLVTGLENNVEQLVNLSRNLSGKLPQTGEIALSEELLHQLGYQGNLQEIVTIDYLDNNQNHQTVTGKLSGVIKNNEIINFDGQSHSPENYQDTISIGDIILPFDLSSNNISCFVYDDQLANAKNIGEFNQLFEQKTGLLWSNIIYNNGYQISATITVTTNINYFKIILAVILIGVTIMAGVTLSSMNRKSHEFALLRAVGQTKKQLSLMLSYQTLIICLIGLIVSIGLSLLISELMLLVIKKILIGGAVMKIDWGLIISMICLGFGILFFSSYLPSRQTSKKALLGTFDEEKFKIIDNHHYRLRHQNVLALARRELANSIRLHLILIVILSLAFISIDRVVFQYQQYLNNKALIEDDLTMIRVTSNLKDGLSKETVAKLTAYTNKIYYFQKCESYFEGFSWENNTDSLFNNNYEEYQGQIISDNLVNYYCFEDNNSREYLNPYLQGRMPENENEIVVYAPYLKQVMAMGVPYRGDGDDTFKIGKILTVYENYQVVSDEITFNNYDNRKDYLIVGIINELPDDMLISDYYDFSLIVNDEEFKRKYQIINDDYDYQDTRYNELLLKTDNPTSLLAKLDYLNYEKVFKVNVLNQELSIQNQDLKDSCYRDLSEAVLSIGFSVFILAYVINYRLINNKRTVGILKSLGMTKGQLYQMYGCQGLIICFGSLLISLIPISYRIYLGYYRDYSYGMTFLLYLMMVAVIISIYVVSIKRMVSQDTIKLIKIRD